MSPTATTPLGRVGRTLLAVEAHLMPAGATSEMYRWGASAVKADIERLDLSAAVVRALGHLYLLCADLAVLKVVGTDVPQAERLLSGAIADVWKALEVEP